MTDLFLGQMDYVFFVYGLAFFLLGAVCLTLRPTAFPRLPWGWLAAFSLSHGVAEWLDLAVLSFGRNQSLVVVKTLVMIASFLFLMQFALGGLNLRRKRFAAHIALMALPFSLVVVAGAWGGLLWFDVAGRYLLGLPGGLLAAAAIYRQLPSSRASTRPWLLLLTIMMAAYGLLAGAIVPQSSLFLSQLLDYQRFQELTSVPVQIFRALAAIAMAVALWIGAELPGARTEEIPFRYALGLAGFMLVLVPGGWALTDALARQSHDDVALRGSHQARAIARVVDTETERIEQAAQLLAINGAVRELAIQPSGSASQAVNLVLDQVAIAFRLEVAYLLDARGTVIASSNRNAPDSFVAANYGFRPYFQTAMAGQGSSYFARGVTSLSLGHYASAPVFDPSGEVRLVTVLKSGLPSLATVASEASDCMLLSLSGLVLDACDLTLDLHSLWPLPEPEVNALIDSRQFGPGPFPPLFATKPESGQVLHWRDQHAMYISAPLLVEGWSVALLLPMPEARTYRLFGIGVTLVISLIAIGFYVLLHAHEVYELRLGALMAQLRDKAQTDPLTRLANRGWFQENFARELKKAHRLERALALIMFDVDYFKSVNDRFGHQAGDRVLVALAEHARLAMRDYDLVSRWGGEEFVAMLPDTDIETARMIAERLREQIASMELPEIGQVTCSFGVAQYRSGESGDSLINRADAALYQAKDEGRNRVVG